MKIILPLIVLLIIIIFTIIILNNNIYFSEDFIGSYNQNTIEDLIPVSYIPFNPYLVKKSTAYEVIDIYKKVLNRSPEIEEIKGEIGSSMLLDVFTDLALKALETAGVSTQGLTHTKLFKIIGKVLGAEIGYNSEGDNEYVFADVDYDRYQDQYTK